MPLRRFSSLCAALLGAALASAAWEDRFLGSPVIEVFPTSVTQAGGYFLSMVQDEQSERLYAGKFGALLSFDGNRWETLAADPAAQFRSLALDAANSRLWYGALGDLGYLELNKFGSPKRVSLHARLPFPAVALGTVWGAHIGRHGVDFVAHDRALRWDGTKFTAWEFPTQSRLFPVIFEGALWFHHQETGLYRLGSAGPEMVAPAANLPNFGVFLLQRQAGRLLTLSNAGICTVEPTPLVLSPPETNEFLSKGAVSCASPLPDHKTLVTTARSGSAILDANGRILKIIGESSGLVANSYGHFVDRSRAIWIFDAETVARVQAPGSIARVSPAGTGVLNIVDAIEVESDSSVWFCMNQLFYRARPAATDAAELVLEPQSAPKRHAKTALFTPHGLITGGFRELHLLHENQNSTIVSLPSRDFTRVVASRQNPDRYFAATRIDLVEVNRNAHGQWRHKLHDNIRNAVTPVTSIAEDEQGGLWLGSDSRGASYVRPTPDGGFVDATPAEMREALAGRKSAVFNRPRDILLVIDQSLFRVGSGHRPERLDQRLPATTTPLALSADGRRLYCYQRFPGAPPAFSATLLVVEFSSDGTITRQRPLLVPNLHTIGDLRSCNVTAENGTDTVWLGGSTGLIQVRAAELADWQPPLPPMIQLLSAHQPAQVTTFASEHQLTFQLSAREFSLRPALRFQTRLGQTDAPWTERSDLTLHEFSNLREGTYTFAARTVNPLGQTSAPTTITFTILPPWYRSPWAYAGYVTLFLSGAFAIARYRENRMRARAELLERTVAERTAQLVAANAAKDEFLASMSHEIRNPMNGVVGLSAAIDIAPLDDEGRHRFTLLRHCASHLASLLEDILDFSKLQAGSIELDPQAFAVADLLDAVAAITTPAASEAGAPLEFAIGPTVPPRLIGDARRLRQILLNYVTNALKYAPRGQIDVTVWARTTTAGHARVTFAVTDQGPGIPASEQERIFEKFERGSRSRIQRIAGTGMGLAVCRKLALAMGGRAWVESEPDTGSTFFLEVELPIAPATHPLPADGSVPSSPRTALVVDDEEYNVIALTTLLQHHGYTVTGLVRASEALVRAETQCFDAIFLDYDMPEITGPQLARRLRERYTPAGQHPLIFATTAYTTVEKRDECLAAGMNGFLGKPVSASRLAQLLAAHDQSAPPPAQPAPRPDPLQNLRRLAAQRHRPLEAEFADFIGEAAKELAALDDAIRRRDSSASARGAHRLIGRFGFIFASTATDVARELEAACQASDWPAVAQLRGNLDRHWADTQRTLAHLTAAPAA